MGALEYYFEKIRGAPSPFTTFPPPIRALGFKNTSVRLFWYLNI